MCDFLASLLLLAGENCGVNTALLGLAIAFIIAALAAISTAIALNGSFCLAPGSPGFMVAAGALSLAAVGMIGLLKGEVVGYWECTGSPEACVGNYLTLITAMDALILVLSIQAAACFAAAGIAWIPWVGAAPMIAIAVTMITQLGLLIALWAIVSELAFCVIDATAPTPGSIVRGVIGTSLAAAIWAVGVGMYIRRDIPWRWHSPKAKRADDR